MDVSVYSKRRTEDAAMARPVRPRLRHFWFGASAALVAFVATGAVRMLRTSGRMGPGGPPTAAVIRTTAQQCGWFEPMLMAILMRKMGVLTVQTGHKPSKFGRALQWFATCLRRAPSNANGGSAPTPDASVVPRGPPVIALSEPASKPSYTPLKLPTAASESASQLKSAPPQLRLPAKVRHPQGG